VLVVVILQVVRSLVQMHDIEPDIRSPHTVEEVSYASVIKRTTDRIDPQDPQAVLHFHLLPGAR